MNLTKYQSTAKIQIPQNTGGEFSGSYVGTGDNLPHSLAVFLCPQFLEQSSFGKLTFIMTALFGQPIWLVAPVRDTANPRNAITRFLAVLCDGIPSISKNRHYPMTDKIRPDLSHRYVSTFEDSHDLTDSIHLMTDRAISILALLLEQFESKDSYSLNHTTIYSAIHCVEKELRDVQAYLNAFSQAQKNPA